MKTNASVVKAENTTMAGEKVSFDGLYIVKIIFFSLNLVVLKYDFG
jgi:hypothetical protein